MSPDALAKGSTKSRMNAAELLKYVAVAIRGELVVERPHGRGACCLAGQLHVPDLAGVAFTPPSTKSLKTTTAPSV
eukprot:1178806-Prorocentrum_minimum.AAC.4